jgi:hypothetical protein
MSDKIASVNPSSGVKKRFDAAKPAFARTVLLERRPVPLGTEFAMLTTET